METVRNSPQELAQLSASRSFKPPEKLVLTFISPDTPDRFLKHPYFTAAAYSSPIPKGYSLNFTNLHASTSTSSYMGFTNLNSYDTKQ